jgi:enoyl-CoA hydratase
MTAYTHILVDDPLPRVRRITLNRPEKRNALSNLLRKEILEALQAADRDPDVSVMIVRGAGPAFSAGYDLSADNRSGQPYHTAGGAGQWSRHVVDG